MALHGTTTGELPQPDTLTFTHMLDVDSDKTQTEAKLQVRADLASLSNSVVSQTFPGLKEILRVLV